MGISTYKWANFDMLDDEILSRYCDDDADRHICWWLLGDVQARAETVDELLILLRQSKYRADLRWGGNSFQVEFRPGEVIIRSRSSGDSFNYTAIEIEEALNSWKSKVCK